MKPVSFLTLFLAVSLCTGNRFKTPRSGLRGGETPERKPAKEILEELEANLGAMGEDVENREALQKKLKTYEEEMKATFNALPKNNRGAIEAPSVRYALHRLFNQRNGWQIKGLETSGGAWDAASPIHAMGDYVPAETKELFEERLGDYGLDLHELAVLAATMDNMFSLDVKKRLDIVFDAHYIDKNEQIPIDEAQTLFTSYISSLILGSRVEFMSMWEVRRNVVTFKHYFPRKQEANELLQDVVKAAGKRVFDYDAIASTMGEFGHRLGGMENRECGRMKKSLVFREERPGNGRVRLGNFYADLDDESWHFTESVDYMRKHGALDESNPEDPRVIIPNYLHMPANCLTPSGFYDICCFDECEALMDHIEADVAAPTASPERIASVVASLEVNRDYNRSGDLTPTLQRLLGEIAAYHWGTVPIHGRLFAQWMHQAFPRECAHPIEDLGYDRFNKTGSIYDNEVRASEEEKKNHVDQVKSTAARHTTWETDNTPTGLWQLKEQLVDHKSHANHIKRSSSMSDIITFGAAGVVGTLLLQLVLGPSMKARRRKDQKLL